MIHLDPKDEDVHTLAQALDDTRLRRINDKIDRVDMFRGGFLTLEDGSHLICHTIRVALLPLVDKGERTGSGLLEGLRSDKEVVRYGAHLALIAIYQIDLRYPFYLSPDSEESSVYFAQWEAIVTAFGRDGT